jgi:Protein of unknown function (DUF2975)
MKSKAENLLTVMLILAWIVFIGLVAIAGSITISWFVSIRNGQAARDLYKGLNLYPYLQHSFVQYTLVVFYKVIWNVTQAYIAFLMTSLLSKLNISRPFNADVVKLMQRISYSILCVWLVAMAYNLHVGILEKQYGITASYISGDSIFLAGIVYILAQMFKRGVEIQSENELTV